MPYNTRRKSLSLPSLGIQLPKPSGAHRQNSKSVSTTASSPSSHNPTKRVKRSHNADEPASPISPPASKVGSPDIAEPRPFSRPGPVADTPPPSPKLASTIVVKIDTDGINDDIVIAVIEQLQKTGNRPHLIRELAAVLASSNDNVAQYVDNMSIVWGTIANTSRLLSSQNPAALLSSRLSLYLKRPWTALSPCPLAKELIPVHPRKVFFFLTGRPRRPLPENSDDIIPPTLNLLKQLTPSVSDPSVIEDEEDMAIPSRARLSLSPEVDLYSPDIAQGMSFTPPTPGESFSGRNSLNPDGTIDRPLLPKRVQSPPLEADERGFTETATAVRARGMSLHQPNVQIEVQPSIEIEDSTTQEVEETPEVRQRRDQELGFELFGHSHPGLVIPAKIASSPMIPPRQDQSSIDLKQLNLNVHQEDVEMEEAGWKMMSPEDIEVEDLDTLFTGF